MQTAIIVLGILYFFAHFLSHFFEKSKIPDVLILMLIGIVVGPVLHWAQPSHFGSVGNVITSIALIIILFESGMNLDLGIISKSMRSALTLTLLCFFGTVACTSIVMTGILHYPLMISLVTGFILGGTSSAVVIPLVKSLSMNKEPATVLILESAFTDVLCIVFTFGFIQGIQSGNVDPGKIAGSILASLSFAAIIGIAGGVVWLSLLDRIRKFPNTQFTTFAFMFILYGIAEMLGYSGAIACLAFGIILGNHGFINLKKLGIKKPVNLAVITEVEKKLYSEMVFLLKTFFFVFLGISIPFQNLEILLTAFGILALLYPTRLIITRIFVRDDSTWRDKSMISVMIPKGLAAAVLASLPLQSGLDYGKEIQNITYMVILFSIIITSVMVPVIQNTAIGKFYRFILRSRGEIVAGKKAA